MSSKKTGGLGRGIDGLLPNNVVPPNQKKDQVTEVESGKPLMIPISSIKLNPDQPRKYFDTAEMSALSDSIRLKGIIEPLIVRRLEDGFELIAGQRRLIAADKADLKEVPAIVREMDDDPLERLEIALIENVHRADLNPIELAETYYRFTMEMGRTDEEVAQLVGKTRPSITGARRLLELTDDIKDDIRFGRLTAAHGLAILQIRNKERWPEARKLILKEQMTVRKANLLAKKFNRDDKPSSGKTGNIQDVAYYEDLEKKFTDSLDGLKVKIYYSGKIKKIEIQYTTIDEMEGIMNKLGVVAN
ncbi:MAG: ParB/RepB/Spo0J family partition protein [Deltaproteobacteria bacterium]|jgi:ParB family chromosome partitioning protein|nr:ParB/RepB/Spo0J family partition protein [Deltaproteobacteria bacterium]